MKTLYFDCGMGAAGDMLCAALLELLPDADEVVKELNGIGIPHVEFQKAACVKCGVVGMHLSVLVHGEEEHCHDHEHHHHSDLGSIESVIAKLIVSDKVKADALAVYRSIAEAESAVHGCPVEQIHFHEVGSLDAVADVTAFCLLMEKLRPDEVLASPVHVGCGSVRCAHGILPVPAPATAYLLKDVPIYGGEIQGELCTPTGAALLKHYVNRFGAMPILRVQRIGYGMGTKDFPAANCVRALMGESDGAETQTVFELSANVDDMTAEQIGFCTEQLFESGALEVYTLPAGMKKNRPGTVICAIVKPEQKQAVLQAFFRHSTTLGIRETELRRHVLSRCIEPHETALGIVRVKRAEGFGVKKRKLEYEDLARIARENGGSLAQAAALAEEELNK